MPSLTGIIQMEYWLVTKHFDTISIAFLTVYFHQLNSKKSRMELNHVLNINDWG